MTWVRPTPAEALEQLEASVVRPFVEAHPWHGLYSCLCCGARGEYASVPHTEACPVQVLREACKDQRSYPDAQVQVMVLDAISRPMGVVPDSCAEVYAAARAGEDDLCGGRQ